MARIFSGPQKGKFQPAPAQPEEISLVNENNVTAGVNTFSDPADIPSSQFTVLDNVDIFNGELRKRQGSVLLTPAKPNSNRVILYTSFTRFDGTTIYLRFDKSKVFRKGVGAWTEITSASPYSITDTDRIDYTVINDRFFFAVGNAAIQEINFGTNTYAALGNAGKYKTISSFFNRVIGGNLYDAVTPNPTLFAWSGDLNFAVWDSITDVSAGADPLLEAGSDFAQPISRTFGFASSTLILRERGLWIATKNPVASKPFSYQAAFPNFGGDCPFAAVQKQNGITWYDYRTNQVYDYSLGSAPRAIGDPIKKWLLAKITDKKLLVGTYDSYKNRYILTIPSEATNDTFVAIYSYDTEAWTTASISNCNGIFALDGGVQKRKINELTGKINSLIGKIDALGNTSVTSPALYFVMKNGDILESGNYLDDNAVAITSVIESKVFKVPAKDLSVSKLHVTIYTYRSGNVNFYYSKDGNKTWILYKTVTLTSMDLSKRKRIRCIKHITTPEFGWKITYDSCDFGLLDYTIEVMPSEFTKR